MLGNFKVFDLVRSWASRSAGRGMVGGCLRNDFSTVPAPSTLICSRCRGLVRPKIVESAGMAEGVARMNYSCPRCGEVGDILICE